MRSDSSRRQPTPRPRKVPSDRSTAMLALLLVLVMVAFAAQIWWAVVRPKMLDDHADVGIITHDSLCVTYTYNGEIIRWYVMTDPDTGRQYLVNDLGGTTPRLDSSDEQMRTNGYAID